MTDSAASLSKALTGRYTLQRELGRGGMATVYLALDLKHQRPVALKVLHPELAAALGSERFLREITTTANLRHPHILPLLDSGEAAGQPFYVMPLVEGESLRDRLEREHQLSLEDALRITREVADALGYAHARGLVHRDIKPENILLEGGHAVVADFGIARAVSASGDERLTQTGFAVGTPAYMSPEQATGSDTVDGRSDLYSLGCVLYEMLAGEVPYLGTTPQGIFAKKLAEPAPRVSVLRGTVPAGIEAALLTVLARAPADRYATAAQFTAALAVDAEAYARRQRRRRLARRLAITVGSLVVGAGLWWAAHTWAARTGTRTPRLVVLPFEILGPPEEGWLAAGVTEEITSRLAKLAGLAVISRTSATLSAGKPLSQVGRDLDVQYALEGSVRTVSLEGGVRRVRVTAQLIRIRDDTHLWSEDLSASMAEGEVFELQAQIAERVAQALNVALRPADSTALRRHPTQIAAAYDAYLRARRYAAQRGNWRLADLEASITLLRQAVELDSNFVEAHAMLSMQFGALVGRLPEADRDSVKALAQTLALRALALDPRSAWAHLALATWRIQWDSTGVQRELEAAAQLDSTSGDVAQAISTRYSNLLRDWNRSLRFAQRAFALDPLNPDAAMELGFNLFALRRHAEAEPLIKRAISLAPDRTEFAHYLAWLYLSWHGSVPEAVAVLKDAVQRMGFERAFVGWLSIPWGTRILAADPWYRAMLERVTLGTPDLDSSTYYLNRAALMEALHRPREARAYYDSVIPVLEGRQTNGCLLALTYGAVGDTLRALENVARCRDTYPSRTASSDYVAWIFAAAGMRERAVAEFDTALSIPNYITPRLLAIDPGLEPLKQVPRWRQILASAR